jgi:hypothetical protein
MLRAEQLPRRGAKIAQKSGNFFEKAMKILIQSKQPSKKADPILTFGFGIKTLPSIVGQNIFG